jgi:hypothetical protein
MKYLIILLYFSILTINIQAQSENYFFDFSKSIIIKASISNVDSDEKARYLDKQILKNNDIVFVYSDYSSKITSIVANSGFDMTQISQLLNSLNYQIISSHKSDFSNDDFYKLYTDAHYKKSIDNNNSKPLMYFTDQKHKDFINYQKYCELWNKKFKQE